MPKAFNLKGCVEAVLIADDPCSIVSRQVESISCFFYHGIEGDKHVGAGHVGVRQRVLRKFGIPKGTDIANLREFSMVSVEELEEIACALRLPEYIPYGFLGENIVVSGIPQLTRLPTGTRLFFQSPYDGEYRNAVLLVWGENDPCTTPGKELERRFKLPDIAQWFSEAAKGRRGIVGNVYVSGEIHAGDTIVVHVPEQRTYNP